MPLRCGTFRSYVYCNAVPGVEMGIFFGMCLFFCSQSKRKESGSMNAFITKCPHCSAELQAQNEFIGTEVECPVCPKTFIISKPEAQERFAAPAGNKSESCPAPRFIFICPECDTVAELPESMKNKEYECQCCCETSVAREAQERNCPLCGEKIKIKATVCKHCKQKIKPLTPFSGENKTSAIAGTGSNLSLFSSMRPENQTTVFKPQTKLSSLILWNMLIPGAGHIYLGQLTKGIVIASGYILIGILPCIILNETVFAALRTRPWLLYSAWQGLCYMLIVAESLRIFFKFQSGQPVKSWEFITGKNAKNLIRQFPSEISARYKRFRGIGYAIGFLGFNGLSIIALILWLTA